jgi:hypothetical protein
VICRQDSNGQQHRNEMQGPISGEIHECSPLLADSGTVYRRCAT